MSTIDELAALLGGAPSGPALPVRYRQGKIVTWDPATARHTVLVGGTLLTDLSVLNTSEAGLLAPGDVVGVLSIGPRDDGGSATWAIIGRVTVPGSPQAQSSLAALRTGTATVATSEATATGTYTDLATYGPEVEVAVGPTGRALVAVGANLTGTGYMSFAVGGSFNFADATDGRAVQAAAATRSTLLTDLTPGLTLFTAKYRSTAGSPAWSERSIHVIAL